MKRLPFVALGLALSAAVTVCLAQQPPSAPESTGTTTGYAFVQPVVPPVNEPAPVPEMADAESLRTQLMERLKQKADLMTAEELSSALSQVQQELHELHGARKLEQARQLLEQITLAHPNTKAAQKAELFLRDWNSNSRWELSPYRASPTSRDDNPI
jgi:hypothetical protein